LNANDERLKPGMSANCQIIVNRIKDQLFVPIDAIHNLDEKTIVYSESGGEIEVKTGKSNSNFIIVEDGLEEDDTILLKSGSEFDGRGVPIENGKKKIKKSSGGKKTMVIISG